jgi:hypothetical protein
MMAGVRTDTIPMSWLEKFKAALKRFAGEKVGKQVLGSEKISPNSTPEKKARWIKEAIERLDSLVEDKETRRSILLCCSHRFPKTRIQKLRTKLIRFGSIDALLEHMHTDSSCEGLSYYEYPKREGNIIYVTKIPYSRAKYEAATNPDEKRRAYCHCSWVRATTEPISQTFCLCGSGWYKTLWEGILRQPVRVEVLKTVVHGDEDCTFAIHLPSDFESTIPKHPFIEFLDGWD